ncbi:MAG TPA: UDP-N-acetylmuramoyl-tripeptide--D-alanyl-D-alanine ligase [Vicinamibacterales bacterium]|nr:UDP-N-acetylmuramoyl-tripeptide--D-alanyl-D-alanine ligase [Vicinamibacterales bacterium]
MAEDALVVTAGLVAEVTGGRLVSGSPDAPIRGFSIDTRTLAPGDLFFALRGARFDGGAFVPAALAAGAGGVVGAVAPPSAAPGAAAPVVIVVDDALRALQALGAHVRRASGARVVAITGSAGKTTTKEATADVLSARYRVYRSRGNLNNHIGLPLSLLELRHRPEIAVVELAMNHAGEIRTLVGLAEPDVRVWTNVGDAHLGFFGSVADLADAKAEILEGASRATVLVANAGDPLVMARAARFAGRVLTFGIDRAADVAAHGVRDQGLDGTTAHVRAGEAEADVHVPLPGRANLENALAAMTVGLHFDVPLDLMAVRVGGLRAAPHRGDVIRLPGGVTVVDDSYNASPTAMERALDVVAGETRCARRIAVLGEMLELGARAVALHERCGRAAAAAGLDRLVAVGGEPARALAQAAIAAGLPADAVQYVATSAEAADVVARMVRPGDLVLVKGSRGIGTDRVVSRLQAESA